MKIEKQNTNIKQYFEKLNYYLLLYFNNLYLTYVDQGYDRDRYYLKTIFRLKNNLRHLSIILKQENKIELILFLKTKLNVLEKEVENTKVNFNNFVLNKWALNSIALIKYEHVESLLMLIEQKKGWRNIIIDEKEVEEILLAFFMDHQEDYNKILYKTYLNIKYRQKAITPRLKKKRK